MLADALMKPSACGRFIVIDSLHIDRRVLGALRSWAATRGLTVQDAIQLAICAFSEDACEPTFDQREFGVRRVPASSTETRTDAPPLRQIE